MACELSTILSVKEIEFDLYTLSTDNTVKQLLEDNSGILLTCCLAQNPLPFPQLPPFHIDGVTTPSKL
jgi:hypothetical protein